MIKTDSWQRKNQIAFKLLLLNMAYAHVNTVALSSLKENALSQSY